MAKSTRFPVAFHTLVILAMKRDEFVSSEFLSKSVHTNPAVIRRILGSLVRQGWVTSQAGVHGGAKLVVDPEEISMLDIYHAVEEDAVFRLHQPNPKCPIADVMSGELEQVMDNAEAAMQEVLAETTVADVARKAMRAYRQKTGKTAKV
ncbi:MAG: Rrf2 family transcriptional regulator [Pirellulaceae bacterium]